MPLWIPVILTSNMTPIRPLLVGIWQHFSKFHMVQDNNENDHKMYFHLSNFNHQTPKQLEFSIFFYTSLFSNKIIKLSNNCHWTVWLQGLLYHYAVINNLFCRSCGNCIRGLLGQSAKKRQEFIIPSFQKLSHLHYLRLMSSSHTRTSGEIQNATHHIHAP
jgi:hypothetical protein